MKIAYSFLSLYYSVASATCVDACMAPGENDPTAVQSTWQLWCSECCNYQSQAVCSKGMPSANTNTNAVDSASLHKAPLVSTLNMEETEDEPTSAYTFSSVTEIVSQATSVGNAVKAAQGADFQGVVAAFSALPEIGPYFAAFGTVMELTGVWQEPASATTLQLNAIQQSIQQVSTQVTDLANTTAFNQCYNQIKPSINAYQQLSNFGQGTPDSTLLKQICNQPEDNCQYLANSIMTLMTQNFNSMNNCALLAAIASVNSNKPTVVLQNVQYFAGIAMNLITYQAMTNAILYPSAAQQVQQTNALNSKIFSIFQRANNNISSFLTQIWNERVTNGLTATQAQFSDNIIFSEQSFANSDAWAAALAPYAVNSTPVVFMFNSGTFSTSSSDNEIDNSYGNMWYTNTVYASAFSPNGQAWTIFIPTNASATYSTSTIDSQLKTAVGNSNMNSNNCDCSATVNYMFKSYPSGSNVVMFCAQGYNSNWYTSNSIAGFDFTNNYCGSQYAVLAFTGGTY